MGTWFRIVAWLVGVLGALGLVFYFFVFDVWTVPIDDPMESASIEPALSAGDVVLLSRHTGVDRGNLLRCADPQAPGRFVVARAIAGPNETFELHEEVATVDGTRLPSPRACDPPTVLIHDPRTNDDLTLNCSIEDYGERDFSALRATEHTEPITRAVVQAGRWYLVSDDRHVHVDSRDFGQIDPATCLHVVFRVVSRNGFGDSKKRLGIIW